MINLHIKCIIVVLLLLIAPSVNAALYVGGVDVEGNAVSAGDLKADGTVPLTGHWDVGAFNLTAARLISDVAGGTAPFGCTSTTVVPNLNVSLLEGVDLGTLTDTYLSGMIWPGLRLIATWTPQRTKPLQLILLTSPVSPLPPTTCSVGAH